MHIIVRKNHGIWGKNKTWLTNIIVKKYVYQNNLNRSYHNFQKLEPSYYITTHNISTYLV